MMNVPPSEARALSFGEYEMLLHHWNEAHGSSDVGAPEHERVQKMIDRINNDPKLIEGKRKARA